MCMHARLFNLQDMNFAVDNPSTEPVDPPAVDSTPAADNVSAKSDEIAPDKNDDPEVLEKVKLSR